VTLGFQGWSWGLLHRSEGSVSFWCTGHACRHRTAHVGAADLDLGGGADCRIRRSSHGIGRSSRLNFGSKSRGGTTTCANLSNDPSQGPAKDTGGPKGVQREIAPGARSGQQQLRVVTDVPLCPALPAPHTAGQESQRKREFH